MMAFNDSFYQWYSVVYGYCQRCRIDVAVGGIAVLFLAMYHMMCSTIRICLCIFTVVVGRRLYGSGICFINVAFLELILLTPLNGSLQNFNTWRVSVGNRTLQRDFFGNVPQNLGTQKLPIFDDARKMILPIGKRRWKLRKVPVHLPKISWTLVH